MLEALQTLVDINPGLHSAIETHSALLFVGADWPSQVTGVPSRGELARRLAQQFGLDATLPLATIAQQVSQSNNRFAFTNFILDALRQVQMPGPFHNTLAQFVQTHHIKTIITTAYDDLLESALQQAGVRYSRVVTDSDVSFIQPETAVVFKLYGDIQQLNTLIVTERDLANLVHKHERDAVLDEVRAALRRHTVLFVGHNLADAYFCQLFDVIAQDRFAHMAYAIWPGMSELEQRTWRDRGVIVLNFELWEEGSQPKFAVFSSVASVQPKAMEPGTYDIFISYSQHDRDWVWNKLLPHLEQAGLHVCIPDRDFDIGVPLLANIERAVDNSRHILLVLTPEWLQSEWTEFESLLTSSTDPAARQRKLIPLLRKPCAPPLRIALLTPLDLTQLPNDPRYTAQLNRLIQQLGGTVNPLS